MGLSRSGPREVTLRSYAVSLMPEAVAALFEAARSHGVPEAKAAGPEATMELVKDHLVSFENIRKREAPHACERGLEDCLDHRCSAVEV